MEPIPQWVVDYNSHNYSSSAGKAIKLLMDRVKELEADRTELQAKVEKRLDVVNGLMQKMKSTLYWHERKEEKDFLTELLNSLKQ